MSTAETASELKRVLRLRDLVFYGIVLIQPIAAVGLFGVAQQMSQGHMVTTILIAMCAMMLTAVSYGSTFPVIREPRGGQLRAFPIRGGHLDRAAGAMVHRNARCAISCNSKQTIERRGSANLVPLILAASE